MDIGAIRAGINQALDGIGYTPYAYTLGDIDPPAVVVGLPQEVNYNATIGKDGLALAVTVYVSLADAEDAVVRMDAALSTGNPESVYDALRQATSSAWRGHLRVPLVNEVGAVDIGNQRLLGAVFRCEMLA